jgi:cell division protein FtsB
MTDFEKPKREERRRTGQLSGVQVIFAAILAIGLFLAIGLSSRITAGQPLQEMHDRVAAEIEQLRREQGALIVERDYVRSDAYVERWAREDGKMVREGEMLVIPVPSGASVTPTPPPVVNVEVQTAPPEPKPWQVWWALFFDGQPPTF